MENNRYKIEEIKDFPPDLRAPGPNSERWSLKHALNMLTLPILGVIGFGFIGYSAGELLHLHKGAVEGLTAFGGWIGAIAGLYIATKPLLDSR